MKSIQRRNKKMNNNKRDVKEQWKKILDKIKKLDNLKMQ